MIVIFIKLNSSVFFVFGVCICSFCFSSSNLSSPFSAGNDLCKHALLSVIYTLILTQKQRSVTKQTSVFIIFLDF